MDMQDNFFKQVEQEVSDIEDEIISVSRTLDDIIYRLRDMQTDLRDKESTSIPLSSQLDIIEDIKRDIKNMNLEIMRHQIPCMMSLLEFLRNI